MGVVTVPQVTAGTTARAADVNNMVNTVANEFNGNIDNTNIKAGAAIADSKIAFGATSGLVLQVKSTNYSAVATGTTLIPYDDTKPQNTEGDQYMSQAITPKSAANQLLIEVTIFLSNNQANSHNIAAIFQDSTADALITDAQFGQTANEAATIHLAHNMLAGTTSATTFKVRAGGQVAGTTTFNGVGGGRKFGGVTLSCITVTEYVP